ncbi:MAG: GNAT family N-acetyltransferase [Planctomycetota bacterium]|nr:GNAT family N-acetyltransferase [Planctomycetota bacterium]
MQLVAPSPQWVDAVLATAHHPLTLQQAPELAGTTKRQLTEFLELCPNGHQAGDAAIGILPTYQFWMRLSDSPDLPIGGGIGLRIGNTYDVVMYYGHIGYHVYPPARGRRYAQRACRLLLPLAARHGINPLWITCNSDNLASRRTCEGLGGTLVEIVTVPDDHPLYQRGDKDKCRYRIEVDPRLARATEVAT